MSRINSKIVLGIDLGTSNSQASYIRSGVDTEPVIVKATDSASEFGKAFPTYIYKDVKTGVWTYGEAARRMALTWGFKNCAREFKKIIGVVDSTGKEKKLAFADEELTGIELSAKFLRYIKEVSEEQSGMTIKDCVITVPAAFDNARREATKSAAEIAGFNVLRLINEPTAAALAYKIGDKDTTEDKSVAVFDIGGGTFDFTILNMNEGALQVTASDGDLTLGGTYMDHALMDYILKDIEKLKGIKITREHSKYQDVLKEIEKVKIELTMLKESRFLVQNLTLPDGSLCSYDKRLERATLERLISGLVARIDAPIERSLKEANISKNQIANVILVGGPSRIPLVIKKAEDIFGKDKICKDINPMECVSIGAAVQGSIIIGNTSDILLVDVVPLSVGVRKIGDMMETIIAKGASLPCSNTKKFTNASAFESNNQSLMVSIFQGERANCNENIFLGDLEVKGLPKARKASLEVDVTLEIDRNGILQVAAKCKTETGQVIENKAVIQNSTKLSDAEIAKRIADFQKNQKSDQELKDTNKKIEGLRSILEEIESFKDTEETVFDSYEKVSELRRLCEEATEFLSVSLSNLINKQERILEVTDELTKHLNSLYQNKEKVPSNTTVDQTPTDQDTTVIGDQSEIPQPANTKEDDLSDQIL